LAAPKPTRSLSALNASWCLAGYARAVASLWAGTITKIDAAGADRLASVLAHPAFHLM
jgi:hypothetical protein